jgi:hypothetical protein
VVLLAARAHAGEPMPETVFGPGRHAVSLTTGYGWGHELFGSERDALDVQTIPVLPRWSMGVTDVVGGGTVFAGVLDVAIEGLFLVNRQPREGSGAGGVAALRYNFLRGSRLVPYLGGGAGILSLDYDLRTHSDGLNFALFGEAGVSLLLSDRFALSGGYRFQHISNARMRTPNLGVDTSFACLGLVAFLP